MGGKNANLVFADADLDAAVAGSIRAAFTNQGQVCHCGSRILIERKAYDAFVERFVAAAKRLASAIRTTRRPSRAPSSRSSTSRRCSAT
jgi:aminomuconate-semialdehyde/2-hydroxymuconate-6-semialdehyde dehydrogenase